MGAVLYQISQRGSKNYVFVYYERWQSPIERNIILKSSILLDVTPCSPLKMYHCFGGICHLCLQCWRISKARNQLEVRDRHVCPKCRLRLTFSGMQDIISQKTELFIIIAVRTSIYTYIILFIYLVFVPLLIYVWFLLLVGSKIAFFRDDFFFTFNTKAPGGIFNKQQILQGLMSELLHINTSFES
jgi:hypothetical protein